MVENFKTGFKFCQLATKRPAIINYAVSWAGFTRLLSGNIHEFNFSLALQNLSGYPRTDGPFLQAN